MAGQGIIGIIASGVRLQADAPDAVGGLEGTDGIGGLPLHLPRNSHIPGACLSRLFQQLLIVQIQDPAQFPGDQLPVLAVLPDLGRAEIDIVNRGADGQEPSFDIGDGAPARGARGLPQLLLQGALLIKIVLQKLDLTKLCQQQGKRGCAAHCHEQQRAAEHLAVRALFVRNTAHSYVLHGITRISLVWDSICCG